jgi:hypothetical protein
MRNLLDDLKGTVVYLFTTYGHTHIGTVDAVLEDVVRLIAPDGVTQLHILLSDISGARPFDHAEDG